MCARGTRCRLSLGWSILLFVLVPAGLGAVVGRAVGEPREQDEPVYRTSMTVMLGSSFPVDAEVSESVLDADLYSAAVETQIVVLRNPSTVLLMVENQIVKAPHRPEYFRGRTSEDIAAEMTSSITVVPRPRTRLADIVVMGPKPDLLPWIARQFWEQFRDMQRSLRAAMLNNWFLRVQSDRNVSQSAFREAEKELETFLAAQNHTLGSLRNAVESLDNMEQHLSMSLLRIEYGDADDDGPDAAEIRARTKLAAHRAVVVDRLRAAEHSLERALALDEVRERTHRSFRDGEEMYARLRRLRDGPFFSGGAVVLEPLMPREPEPLPGPGSTLVGAVAGAFLGLLLGALVAWIRR